MNLLAVLAAKKRAEYIKQKYYYGNNCNNCEIEYNETAMLDFKSLCYNVPVECLENDLTIVNNSIITCNNTIVEVTDTTVCSSDIVVNLCGQDLQKYNTNGIEDNAYIYEEIITNSGSLYFTISNITVNNVIYLNNDITFKVSPTNASVQKVNGTNFIMNLFDYINGYDLLYFKIKPTTEERVQMSVETKPNYTWSITTKANSTGDATTRGVIITNEGVQSVQAVPAASYIAVASLVGDIADDFQAGITNIINFKKC